MLNSLATYFWGSNAGSDQVHANKDSLEQQQEHNIGEHLETQQEGDWVVVRTAGDIASDHPDEAQTRQTNEPPLADNHVPSDEIRPLSETSVQQRRNTMAHTAAHPGLLSTQQLIKNIRLAQRIQHDSAQKYISRSKCNRQNKVYECHSTTNGSNRRSKRIRPSGFISSRFSQRI